MKNYSKTILIVQTIMMYVIQIPLIIGLVLLRFFTELDGKTILIPFIIGICANLLMIPVIVLSILIAIKNSKDSNNCIKTTIKVKIALIPWYIINFLVCFLSFAGMLNPFLIMLAPFVVGVECLVTYIYMASTSIHSALYVLSTPQGKDDKNTKVILGIILSFICCLDIVGRILLLTEFKEE